ncbi:hypothetical protein FVR03_08435 [Pontibacter qinzhouensis]|uniref:Uncharacterized protein n=1 Tax=Pontibacter qinzhouensis TaxID=2603253 RepID=A0A5C8KC99_9BACT|nr:hypothetical protein [Pontibacter qinzhouensis]TXK48048.1 hypothetical protein FVR03_08435 [Pontibacter qinzhouensis]
MSYTVRQLCLFFLLSASGFGCAKKNFFSKTPILGDSQYQKVQAAAPGTIDSVTVQAGSHYKRGGFHTFFWGKHYRDIWVAPVQVQVFNMNETKGGLEIEKLGGGMQTTSLTLTDKEGFSYALRSLDKDPIGVLPKFWQKTFVADVIRNQTSAINPYGALIIPGMAKAAGIPHANPELIYVLPTDTSFGEFNDQFQDRFFMIEEKYTDDNSITDDIADAEDIVSSKKMLKKRFNKDSHFIDQRAFAKARLFDLVINDWDRHEGQWNWAEYDEDGETIYRPIPKDRDNAFYQFDDGVITWLFSRKWAIRKFESFSEDYKDVYALAMNSSFIDQRALPELTAKDFAELATELQASLSDQVIEQAVRQFPDSVYKLVGESYIRKLKNRRDKLPEAAQEFYKILAKEALVVGTDEEDIFEVKRLNDDETAVTVWRASDKKQVYHRVFNRAETDLITLYGLAEDDEFKVSGEVNKGIKVKIVGGRGEDEMKDTSQVKGLRRKTIVYDTKRGTELEAGPETKDKRTSDVRVHAFDREGFSR